MADRDESAIEDVVRRAIQETYPEGKLEEEIDYVDVTYEDYNKGSHLLRAKAPDHELLSYERWMVVTLPSKTVKLRGAGRAGAGEFWVRALTE